MTMTTPTPVTEQPVRLVPRPAVASGTERWSLDAIEALFNLPASEGSEES